MRKNLDYMRRHLAVRIEQDNQLISVVPLEDPFHQTKIVMKWSLRDWLKMILTRSVEVRVQVCGDQVAVERWFTGVDLCERCMVNQIDHPQHPEGTDPGYEHGESRWCRECHARVISAKAM